MMDLQALTKKNQEFIHIATHRLMQDGKTDSQIKDILEAALPEILESQKKGIPARTLFGPPTNWAASFSPKAADLASQDRPKNTNPWLMWLDTSLLFLAVVALLNGVMTFLNSDSTSTGLISLLALGFGGGAAMYMTYHFVYRHMGKDKTQRPGWLKTLAVMGLSMTTWVLLYTGTGFLPTALNPKLPALVLIILGVLAFGGRYYLQRRYNIQNALATPQNR